MWHSPWLEQNSSELQSSSSKHSNYEKNMLYIVIRAFFEVLDVLWYILLKDKKTLTILDIASTTVSPFLSTFAKRIELFDIVRIKLRRAAFLICHQTVVRLIFSFFDRPSFTCWVECTGRCTAFESSLIFPKTRTGSVAFCWWNATLIVMIWSLVVWTLTLKLISKSFNCSNNYNHLIFFHQNPQKTILFDYGKDF